MSKKMRVSFQTRQLLRRYHKDQSSISSHEYESLKERGLVSPEGILTQPAVQAVLKPIRIYWDDKYKNVLKAPNSIDDKKDFQRRDRLFERGYLEKTSEGLYRRTFKPTPEEKRILYGKGISVTAILKEVKDKEALEDFTEYKRSYFRNMKNTLNLLKEKCKEYGVDYDDI